MEYRRTDKCDMVRHDMGYQVCPNCEPQASSGAEQVPGKPWLYAICDSNGSWQDGESCVYQDRASCEDDVNMRNDDLPEGEPEYFVVPLYRAASRSDSMGGPTPDEIYRGGIYNGKLQAAESMERLRELANRLEMVAKPYATSGSGTEELYGRGIMFCVVELRIALAKEGASGE